MNGAGWDWRVFRSNLVLFSLPLLSDARRAIGNGEEP